MTWKFTKSDIKTVENAIEFYTNNERNNAIQEMRKIPWFDTDINWFIMSIIQDLDYADKGINRNSAYEYLIGALEWVKKHQKRSEQNEEISIQ